MRKMSVVLAAIIALTGSQGAYAQASCELGKPAEGMPPEFDQFKFIIGDFDINVRKMTEDGWSDPIGKARWNGRYSLGGQAIMDWWHGSGGGGGVNLRMYDPKLGEWRTAWQATGNFETRDLRQKIWPEDGLLHLWQVYPEAPERNLYFETYNDGRWARIDQRKDPETGEWKPVFMLEAVPAACEPRN